MSVLSLETIIEIVSLLILSILVLRWVNKWHQKRKALKMQRLHSLIIPTRQNISYNHETPEASAPYAARAIMEQQTQPIGLDKYR